MLTINDRAASNFVKASFAREHARGARTVSTSATHDDADIRSLALIKFHNRVVQTCYFLPLVVIIFHDLQPPPERICSARTTIGRKENRVGKYLFVLCTCFPVQLFLAVFSLGSPTASKATEIMHDHA